jgi:hypothetical protein
MLKKFGKRAFTFIAFIAVVTMLGAAAVEAISAESGLALFQTRAGDFLEGSAIPPSISRDNSVYVTSGTTSTGPIKVTLIVEAGNEYTARAGKFWVSHDVTVQSPASGDFTVTDLLVAANGVTSPDLLFYKDNNETPITSQDIYVAAVKHDTVTWTAGQLGFDGWEFRLNDKFPVFANGTGWTGDSILQTNIKDGDIVHFFYDMPADFNRTSGILASDYVRGIYVSSTAASLTVQLQGHTAYIHPTLYNMYVDNYKNVQAGVTAYLYDAAGVTLIDTQESDVNGRVTFSGTFASGDYIVKTDPVYQPAFRTIVPVNTYIALTGAYCKVSIP